MMLTTVLLFILGTLLIFLEFYLPGGILGVMGTLFLFGSLTSFAIYTNSVFYTLFYFIFLTLFLWLLVKFILKNIRYGKFGRKFYLDNDQEGYVASKWDISLVGQEAIVSTDLRPGGHITLHGNRYLAVSQSGYINKGEYVLIVGGEGDSLIVKKINKEKTLL